jgi:DNA-binding cell septation regulator SpoVG
MKMNILDGWFHMEVIDPQDVLVDRYANPWDIQSGRRITHIGIYRTLSDVERNPLYDAASVTRLKEFFATQAGLIKAGQNSLAVADRSQRMNELGVPDVMNPVLGETYVELNECQQKVWDDAKKKDVVVVIVTGNGSEILMQKPLEDILGINVFSWASWAGDTERTDIWSDGGADSVRGLNLVANARWSQKVENGTLANYGMYFYDSTIKEGWSPVGYDPSPFGFYPLPGDPSKVLHPVQIAEMGDVFNELNFIDSEIQGVSGATAIENGDQDPNEGGAQQTAQEIQILAAKAKERAQNVSKYHKRYWEDIGNIFIALVMANGGTMQKPTLHKKGPSGKFYAKTLDLAKTFSNEGYKVKVGSKADKESDSLKTIQKMQVATAQFPNNIPLQKIQKQKTLDWLDLTPEETTEVMNFDDQMPQALPGAPPGPPGATPPMSPMPSMPQPVGK